MLEYFLFARNRARSRRVERPSFARLARPLHSGHKVDEPGRQFLRRLVAHRQLPPDCSSHRMICVRNPARLLLLTRDHAWSIVGTARCSPRPSSGAYVRTVFSMTCPQTAHS